MALRASDAVLEAAVLSTCNRTEVYFAASNPEAGIALIRDAFMTLLGEHAAALDGLLITRRGLDAVRHLCAVASGLESMVIAESQILGQVRNAIDHARELNATGAYLGAAFRVAISCGKRVRTETAIGRTDISAGSVLIDLMSEQGDGAGGGVHPRAFGRRGRLCDRAEPAAHAPELLAENDVYRAVFAFIYADRLGLTDICRFHVQYPDRSARP